METVDRYERFLFDERGASLNTVEAYLSTVRTFLGDRFESRPADLGSLGLHDVNGFIRHSCQTHSPATTRVHVAALRSFVGYLYQAGVLAADVADGIAGVRTWRLSSLPKGLEPDQVEAVLACCNRGTVTGRRDVLPLPHEAGEALVAYLHRVVARPRIRRPRTAQSLRRRHVGFDHSPLRTRQIACVAQTLALISLSSDFSPYLMLR